MLTAALTLLLQVAPPAGADIDDQGTITVTAQRLSDLAADVAACTAAPCPTRRDVAVSVAYASALFREGQYREAKGVLTAAVARNKGAAAAEPIAVSQLYNAQAMVAKHYGNADIVRRATHSSFTILRDNVGATALPTLLAEYRVAQWQLRLNRFTEAETQFTRVGRTAVAAGHPEIADVCDLYRAQLLARRREASAGFQVLDAMAARDTQTAEGLAVRRAALAAAVRMASDLKDSRRADAYAEMLLAMGPGDIPLLLSSKPLPKPGREIVGWRWVDIGYWIRPDGSVDEVEVLRGTERNGWAAPLLQVVAARRFAPTAGTIGHYRVERYTMTADYDDVPGGINLRRASNPRYEMTPMTAGSALTS